MPRNRFALPAILAASMLTLPAQTPLERIQLGFRSLPTGNWDYALREWTKDGTWVDVDGKLKQKLDAWIASPRSFGHWEAISLPHLTATWQRHWVMASFDQGAVFFSFDYVLHKAQWRLIAIQVTQEPSDVLPHLDLLPAVLALRNQ
jgi:hypothetical protein